MKVQTLKNWFARVGSVAVIGTVCGAIGGLGGYAALSYAAGQNLGGANDYQIPYQGILELGGQPVDGPTEFVFTLYTSKDSVAPADKIWTSNPRTLQVSRGYFATVLGDETDLDNRLSSAVMAENVLYIGMKVDGVELAGRQRILAVPYSQNGAPGKNFVVDGKIQTIDLAVLGNGVVGGTLRVTGASTLTGKVTASNGLDVSGATTLKSTLGVSGSTTIGGSLRVDGNVTTGGTEDAKKLVQFRYFSFSQAGSRSTGMSASDWNCAVGGFRFWGDFQESGKHEIVSAYTTVNNNVWHVHHKLATHNDNADYPDYRVGVVCFSTKISHKTGSWF